MTKFTKAEVEEFARALYARLLDEDAKDRYEPPSAFDWRKDAGASFRMEELAGEEDPDEFIKRSGRSAFELLKDDEDLLDLDYWQTTVKSRDYQETDLLVSMLLEGTGLAVERGSAEYTQLGINAARAFIAAKRVQAGCG